MHGSGTVEMYGVYFHTNCQQDDLDSQSLSGTRISTANVWETHQNCGSNSNPDPGCIFTSQDPWTGRKTNYCSGGGCVGQLWTGIAFDSCTEIGCIKFRSNYGYFPTSIDVQRFTSEGWTTVHSFECADGRRCNDGPEEIPTGQSECGTLPGIPRFLQMCNSKSCGQSGDFCCLEDCSEHGGERSCGGNADSRNPACDLKL